MDALELEGTLVERRPKERGRDGHGTKTLSSLYMFYLNNLQTFLI
jgi:hypothetical protein